MAKLARTPGLTDVQQEILSTVRSFVEKEILPHASAQPTDCTKICRGMFAIYQKPEDG